MTLLSVTEVQTFIRDQAENNRLIDGEEFTPTLIELAKSLAISEWNMLPPVSFATEDSFPQQAKSLLMSGTLWKLFQGQAALKARNTMNYSDGGLQIPVEEQFQLYQSLASMWEQHFKSAAQALKIHLNIESGWGEVTSDYSQFPLW